MESYEQYITVQEAAERLNRPEPEVWRMLETGALPAMLRAALTSKKDGTPIGFDFALLPPEGVRLVVDQGGDDFTLEWAYCGGHGQAVCFPARPSSIRVLWEVSQVAGLIKKDQDVPKSAVAPDWHVFEPKRDRGYNWPLYRFLAKAHEEGRSRPRARDVVESWLGNKPPEIAKVLSDGFDYYDRKGNAMPASMAALQKSIDRLTGR